MPAALRESSDGDVRRCLEDALAEVLAGSPRVAELRRSPFAYETSFAIDELRARLDDDEELHLLVKDVGAGLSAAATTAKPARALDRRREIAVYRQLLHGSRIPAPRFYGAVEDEESGRAWLFLERLPGAALADVGDAGAWRAAAAWAAQVGAATEARDPALDRVLLHRDRSWHEHWIGAATAACERGGRAELAARLSRTAPAFLDRLEALPRALVHGELYASNVLIDERSSGTAAVRPVDWEMAGTGPFALDLAALVTGWADSERESMCAAFQAALPSGARMGASPAALREAVVLCELALALQWLGWSSDWLPPAEHRRDWAAEAERLLEEAGL